VTSVSNDTAPGVGELLGRVASDVQDLVRGEIRLARSEFDQKLDRMLTAGIWFAGGALVAFAGLVVVLQGLAAILALVLPVWAAFFAVGAIIVAVGGFFARSGLARISIKNLTPERTATNLSKDARVLKEHR
jgi:uncharacterized membrane protein YqjE